MKQTDTGTCLPDRQVQISDSRQQINKWSLFAVCALLARRFVFAGQSVWHSGGCSARPVAVLFGVFFLLSPETVFASGGGGEADWGKLIPPLVNFGILVGVIFYFGRKPIKDFFRNRTEMIEKSLKEAQEAKVLAQQTLDQVKERLKNTDQEINEILEASKKSGEKEKESIIAEGERISAKIIEQAQSNIAFELQKARESIKSEAALLALELAEKQIKSKLGAKEQETLIDEYIRKLEVKN